MLSPCLRSGKATIQCDDKAALHQQDVTNKSGSSPSLSFLYNRHSFITTGNIPDAIQLLPITVNLWHPSHGKHRFPFRNCRFKGGDPFNHILIPAQPVKCSELCRRWWQREITQGGEKWLNWTLKGCAWEPSLNKHQAGRKGESCAQSYFRDILLSQVMHNSSCFLEYQPALSTCKCPGLLIFMHIQYQP